MPDSYIEEAFTQTLKGAKEPERWYVSLVEAVPFYGGPEEGGWWGADELLRAFEEFPTKETANRAQRAVRKLAAELAAASQENYGRACLMEMEWLEARGLDADYLPEPDGPSTFAVVVTKTLPKNQYGERHYS